MVVNRKEPDGITRIRVVGVGGGGSNAVSRMFHERVTGIEYQIVNTDTQALLACDVPYKLSIGDGLTAGKGVGGDPEKSEQVLDCSD